MPTPTLVVGAPCWIDLYSSDTDKATAFFRVADTDAALSQVVELGGTIVRPAEDTPYGRLAEVTDPTGTLFKLVANI